MKNKLFVSLNFVFILLILFSCNNKTKKPYGAVDIEFGNADDLNIEGPSLEDLHDENTPPNASINLSLTEEGPKQNEETEKNEPTADMDSEPDYGGIPIVTKESVS